MNAEEEARAASGGLDTAAKASVDRAGLTVMAAATLAL
jgi:hypothetical protein